MILFVIADFRSLIAVAFDVLFKFSDNPWVTAEDWLFNWVVNWFTSSLEFVELLEQVKFGAWILVCDIPVKSKLHPFPDFIFDIFKSWIAVLFWLQVLELFNSTLLIAVFTEFAILVAVDCWFPIFGYI